MLRTHEGNRMSLKPRTTVRIKDRGVQETQQSAVTEALNWLKSERLHHEGERRLFAFHKRRGWMESKSEKRVNRKR